MDFFRITNYKCAREQAKIVLKNKERKTEWQIAWPPRFEEEAAEHAGAD